MMSSLKSFVVAQTFELFILFQKNYFQNCPGKIAIFEKQTTWPAEESITESSERSERSKSKRTMWRILNALIAVCRCKNQQGLAIHIGRMHKARPEPPKQDVNVNVIQIVNIFERCNLNN